MTSLPGTTPRLDQRSDPNKVSAEDLLAALARLLGRVAAREILAVSQHPIPDDAADAQASQAQP